MSTTTSETTAVQERGDYPKRYQAARAKAVTRLIKAHRAEWEQVFSQEKHTAGIADASERRLEKNKEKAAAMLASLKEQGVDVTSLI